MVGVPTNKLHYTLSWLKITNHRHAVKAKRNSMMLLYINNSCYNNLCLSFSSFVAIYECLISILLNHNKRYQIMVVKMYWVCSMVIAQVHVKQ